jgi:AI-2 transport protein TqsA
LLTLLAYLVVNVTIGNLLEPRFMGQRLGLSPLVVILSMIFWGWVLGPIGMVLSVPLTMIGKIALATSEDTRWIAVLLE